MFTPAAEAYVLADTSFAGCQQHFYRNTPPSLAGSSRLKGICQTTDTDHYATLYDQSARIPVYSAYRLTDMTCANSRKPPRGNSWYVEPQLAGPGLPAHMDNPGKYKNIGENQATNEDYRGTDYNRGHLNPVSHQCTSAGRNATMTLTNAVPQEPCFNKEDWRRMENQTFHALLEECTFPGARRYVVTGAVSSKEKIPRDTDRPENTDPSKLERVSVPAYMWSAVCCDSTEAPASSSSLEGWSYGFYGRNQPVSSLKVMSVKDLDSELSTLYGSQMKIFEQHCFTDGQKAKEMLIQAENLALRLLLRSVEKLVEPFSKQQSDLEHSLDFLIDNRKRKQVDICMSIAASGSKVDLHLPISNAVKDQLLPQIADNGLTCKELSATPPRQLRSVQSTDDTRYCQLGKAHPQQLSISGCVCKDECARHEGTDYYWCHTYYDWDYCCAPWHHCTERAYSESNPELYNWCYIDDYPGSSWEYCYGPNL